MNNLFVSITIVILLLCLPFKVFGEIKLTFQHSQFLPISIEEFNNVCEEIYKYECDKLNFFPDLAIDIKFTSYDTCYIRGQAHSDSISNTIVLCIDNNFSRDKLFGVFAHELGHIILFRWISSMSATPIAYFNEGFASWLAGKYYLRWHNKSNFKDAANSIPSSDFIDLENTIYTLKLQPIQRDILYIEWASFVDFLVSKYSLNKIQDFCHHLSGIQIEYYNPKEDDIPSLINSNDLSEEELKNHIAILEKKMLQGNIEVNKRYTSKFNSAYKTIFGFDFDELKQKWLEYIAI